MSLGAGPVRHDLVFTLGSTWVMNLTAKDGTATTIDITGATIKWRISTTNDTVVDTRETGDGITIVDGTNGAYQVIMTPADQTTAGITASTSYKHEIQLTSASAVVYDQLYGYLRVEPSLFA